jgi:hypothetical protein
LRLYEATKTDRDWKRFDLHERLLLFACDVVRAVDDESDGASSNADFIAKNRIALRETKEAPFRLRVCRRLCLVP